MVTLPISGTFAQSWPNKPVKVVVSFPPGGAADQIAGVVGQPLQEALGQPVIIENRSGSGGNLGGDAVANAAPDVYTVLMSSGDVPAVLTPAQFRDKVMEDTKRFGQIIRERKIVGD